MIARSEEKGKKQAKAKRWGALVPQLENALACLIASAPWPLPHPSLRPAFCATAEDRDAPFFRLSQTRGKREKVSCARRRDDSLPASPHVARPPLLAPREIENNEGTKSNPFSSLFSTPHFFFRTFFSPPPTLLLLPPTKQNAQLIQRTANVERNKPDHCGDYLACRIRDVKMPFRAAFFTAVHFGFRFNWWLYSKVAKAICPGGCNTFDARTRWFDEAVLATLERREFGDGGEQQRCDTVVALAAGFDTRCLRLSRGRPDVRFIELDLPHVSEKKRRLVEKLWPEGKASSAAAAAAAAAGNSSEIEAADASPSTSSSASSSSSSSSAAAAALQLRHPVFVGSDMLDPARASRDLAAAGWRRNAPCATTIEGLLYYLPLDKAEAALETVARTVARGSTLAFDFWPRECLESGGEGFYGYKRAALMVADLGEPFLSGFPHERDEHAAFAARFGFRLRELLGPEEIAARYFPHKRHEPSKKKLAVTTFMYFALWEKI